LPDPYSFTGPGGIIIDPHVARGGSVITFAGTGCSPDFLGSRVSPHELAHTMGLEHEYGDPDGLAVTRSFLGSPGFPNAQETLLEENRTRLVNCVDEALLDEAGKLIDPDPIWSWQCPRPAGYAWETPIPPG
jgi:hypothetical protein